MFAQIHISDMKRMPSIQKVQEEHFMTLNISTVMCVSLICVVTTVLKVLLFSYIAAVVEAEDIDLHLRTLRRLICAFEERSFSDLEPLIPALFHTLALIWTHSHFYCHPKHIVTLLTEFSNLLIDKVNLCPVRSLTH